MTESPLHTVRARSRPRVFVRRPPAPGRTTRCPAPGPRPSGPPLDITHGTTVVAIRFAGGVVMAGDRRATAGYTIANRRIEKVFPADDYSGVAIAGAAGPAVEMVRLFQVQLEHYEKVEGEQLSLEGKANQLAQMVRANLPAAMQGFVVVPLFAGFDHRRATRPGVQLRRHRRQVRRGRLPGQRLRRRARPQLDQGRLARGHEPDDAIELAIRSLFAAADEDVATGGPDLVRRDLPDRRVIDADGLPRASTTTTSPPGPRPRCWRARARRRARNEHAVLRLARTGDEGPRRLRAEGHRPRPQPRGAGVRRRRADRRREPVPHALQDQRDLRPHRVRRRSASTTSSRCCGSRASATPTSRATRTRREDVNAQGARQRLRADARPGVHPRDEAVRGRDPRGRGRRDPTTSTTSCSTSSTTAPSWTSRASPCSAARPSRSPRRSRRSTRPASTSVPRSSSAPRCSATDEHCARRRPARGRAARPHAAPAGVPPHQGRRARRHPRRR